MKIPPAVSLVAPAHLQEKSWTISRRRARRKCGEPRNWLAVDWCERRGYAVLTFRERMREEAAKSPAVESTDPWRLTLAGVHGKVDFFDVWRDQIAIGT
jgi:hypothetical protein